MIDRRLNYGREAIAEFLRESAPFGSVLDIGAGHGDDLLAARRVCPAAQLHAAEAYPPNVGKLTASGINVHEINIEREQLPLGDDTLDVVITNQTLEHMKEVFWILHELSRVLRVGGKLLIGVPNLASLHNRLLLLFGRQPTSIKNNSAHVRGFTRMDMIRLLETGFPGGYQLRRFRGGNFYPFPAAVARPLATLLPNMAWSIFLLLEKQKPYGGEFLRVPVDNRLETNFFLGPESAAGKGALRSGQ